MLTRRSMFSVGAGACLGAGLSVAVGAPAAGAAQAARPRSADEQLQDVLDSLENLPRPLREGSPDEVPHYERRIKHHLKGVKTVDPQAVRRTVEDPGTPQPMFDPVMCPIELGAFVLSTGIPVGKIIQYIRRARQIWGSVRGIWNAVKSGDAAGAVGSEAAELLGELLGSASVVNACF